ncbi:MAG: L-2-hydroxyglutarate oxidase [Bacteroidota bacterium]
METKRITFAQMKYDVIIAGGGIVGLATALRILKNRPDAKVAVLEKESRVAQHQSSRNSGVIHSGIYYKPGSLRAVNCRRGYDMMTDFCRENGIPFDICGKIIAATSREECMRLDGILERGIANGLTGIRKITAAEAREIEPHVACLEAIFVPQSGIVDYGEVAGKYAELIVQSGGEVVTEQKVTGVHKTNGEITIETSNSSRAQWHARVLVNCGGLYSDKLADMTGADTGLQIIPFRGEYYDLIPERQYLVKNLVYPLPNLNFPFLGVHFTRMIGGGIEAGPNAVLAFRREGYSRRDFHAGEFAEILSFPGFRKIARKYWRDGLGEMKRSYFKQAFVSALQRLVPEIKSEDLVPGRSGVRAMACDREGNMLDDFAIYASPGIVNVCNAPSPAATASLAIGETVAAQVLEQL